MKHLKLLLALLIPFFLTCTDRTYALGVQGIEAVSAGSLIIPMDNNLQENGGSFNLKAYGLVVQLLESNIPVKRIILQSKPSTESIDLTVLSKKVFPTTSLPALTAFRGGPFIIDKADAAAAKTIISSFGHGVAVYESTDEVLANVSLSLHTAPKLAFLSDNSGKDDLRNVLEEAEINNYKTINYDHLRSTDCYSTVIAQDWKKDTRVSSSLALRVKDYVNSGGNFLALNWGIIEFENSCRFQTNGGNGFKESGNAGTLSYLNTELPFTQIHGNTENDNSNLRSYSLDNATLKSGTREIIKDNANRYKATTIKFSVTAQGGNIFYLSANLFKGSEERINASRMFLNAILTPAERPNFCAAFIDFDITVRKIENADCSDRTLKNEVVIRNLGNVPAINLSLTGKRDSKLNFLGSSSTSGLLDLLGLKWSLPILLPGRSEKLTITYTSEADTIFNNTFFIDKNPFDDYQENDTARIAFAQLPLPSVDAGDNIAVCPGSQVFLGEEPDEFFDYTWSSKPSGFNFSGSKITILPSVTTLYYLTKTNISTGCSSKDSVFVEVKPLPALANAGEDKTLCGITPVVLGAENDGEYRYTWSSLPVGFSSSVATPEVAPSVTTTYYLKKAHIVNGCASVDSVLIKIIPSESPANAGQDQSVCYGTSIYVGEENADGYIYQWSSKPSGFLSSLSKAVVTPSADTYYYLTKTDIRTGCKSVDSVFVQVGALPSQSDAGEDVSTYFDHLFLDANIPKKGRGEWILVEGSGKIKDPSDPKTEVTELGIGKNIFQWSISNAPCQDFKDEVVIELLELKIPTTITPNNDGLNDVFEITGIEFYPDNVVTVFNRWGTVIFSKSGYRNDWNGRSEDGKELSEDTYFCTVEVNGKVVHRKYLIIKR